MVVSNLYVIAVQLNVRIFIIQYLIIVCVLRYLKPRAILGALLLDPDENII